VRDTAPNVQSFETETYQTEVVQADADVAGDQQLRHAKEQLTIAKQYPGRARSLPSGAKVIDIKRSLKP
jgi:hypothetical protein